MEPLKVLLVYPEYPDTFWSFKYVLKIVAKKASFPPLGLLTVAAMLPEEWEKKLIDMNIAALKDEHIGWADYVLISAMITQKESAKEVIARCNKLGTKVIVGGPVFTTGYEEFEGIDHFILGEAETTLSQFLTDLQKGKAKQVYVSDERPALTKTPVPLWSLINVEHYASMSIQYSRGCPYDCEFCDIIIMNGRVPRTKDVSQILEELQVIYKTGFRGSVFIVDDNFIGNKARVKKLLPVITKWQEEMSYPFSLLTEASLDISDDEALMEMMVEAGFDNVFIGIETPNEESLIECNKFQNKNRDMIESVKKIQRCGMEVMGGFIVGFDNDPLSIFEKQIRFIQESGIVIAMVGMLNALPKTRLYIRLKNEGRLLVGSSGDNTDGSLNFIPRIKAETLISGYNEIVQTIYSPKEYYERITTFLKEYKPIRRKMQGVKKLAALKIASLSIWYLGVVGESRWQYWKFMIKTAFKYPRTFIKAATLATYGLHFREIIKKLDY